MSTWTEIDLSTDRFEHVANVNGIRVKKLVSPYDVPEAIRGFVDQTTHRFIIEFRYLGEERWEPVSHDPIFTIRQGVNSKRLYGLEIDLHQLPHKGRGPYGEILDDVLEAIKRLAASLSADEPRYVNYELATDAIVSKQDPLFTNLAACAR